MEYAETKSSRSSLRDTNSPQYKAVEWLAHDHVEYGSWIGYELLQRYVLRVLYHSTGGENWNNDADTTWFGASSVCDWGSANAQCNDGDQQVDYLFLWNDNLEGTIPDELGLLTALTELFLLHNFLTGTIPPKLGQLAALERLQMDGNQLTGTIPSQLGQLTALTYLGLDSNRLTGTIPLALAQLTNLNILFLGSNNLTGRVPSGFCAAPFPDWRADGVGGGRLYADCISEVQCDCCDVCYDASGNGFCWSTLSNDFIVC